MNSKNTKLYIPDIECDSCIRVISKKLKQQDIPFIAYEDSVDVAKEDVTKTKEIISKLQFRVSETPFERKTLSERFRDFKENPKKYLLEKKVFLYSFIIFIILIAIQSVAFYTVWNTSDFFNHYAIWLLYLDISIAVIAAGIWHPHAKQAVVRGRMRRFGL